jgi:cytochrome c-type biogenesis protein CcmH
MNMGLALGMLGLTTLAVALLLVPLIVRNRRNETRDAYNLAVYRDQLAELERDVARGIIEPGEAEAAKSEIGRRILALAPAAAAETPSQVPLAVAAVAIIMLPFAAWSLYWDLGSPSVLDQPFASRSVTAAPMASAGSTPAANATAANPSGAAADPHVDMAEAVRKLVVQLQAHPDDLNSWVLLARSYIELDRFKDAADAYKHAVDLSGQKPELLGDWAEALVLAADGAVTPEAQQAFQTALADPDSVPRSRYYLALAKLQAGDPKTAIQSWVDLEAEAPADADYLPLLRRRIAEATKAAGVDPASLKTSAGVPRKPPPPEAAAKPHVSPPAAPPAAQAESAPPAAQAESTMPTSGQVAETAKATASMSPQEREKMINGMVERLADKLKQNPDDIDGWNRLGRSYMILNQPAKAQDAYARAVKLAPDDTSLKQQYAEAMIEASPGDDVPPQAIDLMREVLRAEPQNPEALWYVGVAEQAVGHKDAANELLNRLLSQLPANAPARKQVEDRLAGLKGEAK